MIRLFPPHLTRTDKALGKVASLAGNLAGLARPWRPARRERAAAQVAAGTGGAAPAAVAASRNVPMAASSSDTPCRVAR